MSSQTSSPSRSTLARLRHLTSVLVATAMAAGCSDSRDSASTGGTEEIAEFCDALARSSCEMLAPCCNVAASECVQVVRAPCLERYQNGVTRGFAFDATNAASCVEASSRAIVDCEYMPVESAEFQDYVSSCNGALVPAIPIGKTCSGSLDAACVSTGNARAACRPQSDDEYRCARVSVAHVGQACGANNDDALCDDDSYCDFDGQGDYCVEKKATDAACEEGAQCFSGFCDGACSQPRLSSACAAFEN